MAEPGFPRKRPIPESFTEEQIKRGQELISIMAPKGQVLPAIKINKEMQKELEEYYISVFGSKPTCGCSDLSTKMLGNIKRFVK